MAARYWDRYGNRQTDRRHFLRASGGAGLTLAGCGGDDGESPVRLATPARTQGTAAATASARPGGPGIEALALRPLPQEIFRNIEKKTLVEMYYVPGVTGAGTAWTACQGCLKGAMDYRTRGYGQATEEMPYRWHA